MSPGPIFVGVGIDGRLEEVQQLKKDVGGREPESGELCGSEIGEGP